VIVQAGEGAEVDHEASVCHVGRSGWPCITSNSAIPDDLPLSLVLRSPASQW